MLWRGKAPQDNQVLIRNSIRLMLNTLYLLASSFSVSLYWGREERKSSSFLKPFHKALKSKTQPSPHILRKRVVDVNLNRLKLIIYVHTFETDSNQSEVAFILLSSVPPGTGPRMGSWVGVPQFGEKIERDMDLCHEQDTDFKEYLCSWLLPVKGCRSVGFLLPYQQPHRSALAVTRIGLLPLKNWMAFQW